MAESRNKIMCHKSTIVKRRQMSIRRDLDRRGFSMKAVAADAGIPYATLLTYFPANRDKDPAQIPGGVIFALADSKAIPLDLLSLLLPDSCAIVATPEGLDHDKLAELCQNYLAEKHAAHHPESEDGREISDGEDKKISEAAAPLRAVST